LDPAEDHQPDVWRCLEVRSNRAAHGEINGLAGVVALLDPDQIAPDLPYGRDGECLLLTAIEHANGEAAITRDRHRGSPPDRADGDRSQAAFDRLADGGSCLRIANDQLAIVSGGDRENLPIAYQTDRKPGDPQSMVVHGPIRQRSCTRIPEN